MESWREMGGRWGERSRRDRERSEEGMEGGRGEEGGSEEEEMEEGGGEEIRKDHLSPYM